MTIFQYSKAKLILKFPGSDEDRTYDLFPDHDREYNVPRFARLVGVDIQFYANQFHSDETFLYGHAYTSELDLFLTHSDLPIEYGWSVYLTDTSNDLVTVSHRCADAPYTYFDAPRSVWLDVFVRHNLDYSPDFGSGWEWVKQKDAESRKVKFIPVDAPVPSITSITTSPAPTEDRPITIRAWCQNTGAAGPVKINLIVDGYAETSTVKTIPQNGSSDISFEYTPTEPGEHTICVTATPDITIK